MTKHKLDTMTVGMLIKQLQQHPNETPVVFGHPSHDYWRTELAGEIGDLVEGAIEYTGYHECFKIVDPEKVEGKDEDEDGIISVLVIR